MKKKVLAVLMSAAMLLSVSPFAAMADYVDMPDASHWSYNALNAAAEQGLLQGSNGKIAPNDNLTRAQMATILVRAFGATEAAENFAFADVLPTDWFYNNMSIAVKMGWFQGGGSNTLRPNDPISRQEVFVVLARAIGAVNSGEFVLAENFVDASDVASWATDAAAAMAVKGYIKGANGKMNPLNKITRAEFAQLMYNLIQGGEITLPGTEVTPKPEEEVKEEVKEEAPEKEPISGGNTSGGNTSGGNTSGGNTSGGNTSGGNTSGGNTSGGNTSGGNTSGGNTSGGNTSDDDLDIEDIPNNGDSSLDNDFEDPWDDEVIVPDGDEPSMEELATSDEGWTNIY